MTPELEERLGKAMALLAVDENKRMRERMGGSLSQAGLQSRMTHQANAKRGGKPKGLTHKELKRRALEREQEKLLQRLKELDGLLK
jgi:ABC-type Na+ transport system ATPase subunit NatA